MPRFNVSLVVAAVVSLSPEVAAAQMRVGPNVQVSVERAERNYGEMQIRAHPTDSATLIACSSSWGKTLNEANGIDVYFSRDAGRTWKFSALTPGVDPVCALAADGTAYVHGSARIRRLPRGGTEWLLADTSSKIADDRQAITVDNTSEAYRGRVYVAGLTDAPSTDAPSVNVEYMGVWHSKDGGRTFRGSSRPLLSLPPRGAHMVANNPSIFTDGSLLVAYTEHNTDNWQCNSDKLNARFLLMKSTDGGETFKRSTIAQICSDFDAGTAAAIPALAADGTEGPLRGRLYAAWLDRRSGRFEVLFNFSADTGKTWSKPVAIHADRKPGAPRDDLTPRLAVNRNGVVGIAWGNRQGYSDNLSYDQHFTASYDGGVTWLPSVRVSAVPASWQENQSYPLIVDSNRANGEQSVHMHKFAFTGGDYAGLDADAAGVFHLLWADNRNRTSQLWTGTVTVPGMAAPLRSAAVNATGVVIRNDLENYVSLKSRVALELETESADFDQKQRVITLYGRLRNLSDQSVQGPFIVKATRIASVLGAPAAINSANKQVHDGAQWEFNDVALGAKAESLRQKFVFRIDNYVPPGTLPHLHDIMTSTPPSFFSFVAEVFGPAAEPTAVHGHSTK
jgi:hypothetical protein